MIQTFYKIGSVKSLFGGFALPVLAGSVRSPFFQLTDMRKVGKTGRVKNLTLKNKMKAILSNFYDLQAGANRKVSCDVGYFDNTNMVEVQNMDIYFNDVNTTKDFFEKVKAQILAHAVAQSYSMTEDDIIFNSVNPLDAKKAETSDGLSGYLSPQIDGKTVGNTTIFTNNSGRDFLLTEYFVGAVNVSGLGTAPVINVGSNPSTYNDNMSGISLSFANTPGKWTKKAPDNNQTLIADGDSLVCRVATAAILTTTYDFRVLVRGVYVN